MKEKKCAATRRKGRGLSMPPFLLACFLVSLCLTMLQLVASQPTAVLDNATTLTDIDPDSDLVECEIELTYSANAINMPKFDATFVLRNNRAKQLSAWQGENKKKKSLERNSEQRLSVCLSFLPSLLF